MRMGRFGRIAIIVKTRKKILTLIPEKRLSNYFGPYRMLPKSKINCKPYNGFAVVVVVVILPNWFEWHDVRVGVSGTIRTIPAECDTMPLHRRYYYCQNYYVSALLWLWLFWLEIHEKQ